MKKLYYLSIYLTLFITIAAPFSFYSIKVSAENLSGFQTEGIRTGIKEVLLSSGAGKVRILLPDDIRPGDTISGTIIAEPEGKTDAERSKNAAELNNNLVEIAGARQNAWETVGKNLRSTIRFALTADKTPMGTLKSTSGTPISNFNVPVSSIGITTTPNTPPTPEDFKLPELGQTGRPVQIVGPFDGSFDNTTVNVGSQPAQVLAESPRSAVFRSPEDITGPTELAMKEATVAKAAPYRNVGVRLSVPKTNLIKGETTTLTIQAIGLQGIKDPILVQLVASDSIKLAGGNIQAVPFAPDAVNSSGISTTVRTITALGNVVFSVVATVLNPGRQGECECKCELGKTPIETAGKRSISGGSEHSFEPNVKVASCNGNKCEVSGITYSWSVGAGSTATYKVREGTDKAEKLVVDVTGDGTLELAVTVTVKCSDDSTCTASGGKTFTVKK